jgi:hypothetical protein
MSNERDRAQSYAHFQYLIDAAERAIREVMADGTPDDVAYGKLALATNEAWHRWLDEHTAALQAVEGDARKKERAMILWQATARVCAHMVHGALLNTFGTDDDCVAEAMYHLEHYLRDAIKNAPIAMMTVHCA